MLKLISTEHLQNNLRFMYNLFTEHCMVLLGEHARNIHRAFARYVASNAHHTHRSFSEYECECMIVCAADSQGSVRTCHRNIRRASSYYGNECCAWYTHQRIVPSIFTAPSQILVWICHQYIRRTFSDYVANSTQNIIRHASEYCRQYSQRIISIWWDFCKGCVNRTFPAFVCGCHCKCTEHFQISVRMCHLDIQLAFSEYGCAYCTEYTQ